VTEAFPFDSAPRHLIRDGDGVYGGELCRRLKVMGIQSVRTAPRSPWQNAYCERLIGTTHRECLDHVIVTGELHLQKILSEFFEYYNRSRTHQALDGDAPDGRRIEPAERGRLRATPVLGGLHHRYGRNPR
jgi:putative transposase